MTLEKLVALLTGVALALGAFYHADALAQIGSPGSRPAGANTQIQYNNSGQFGATANFAWNGTSLLFGGTGKRIQGDFSSATRSSRLLFQSSTTNGGTVVGAIPNGTGTAARYVAYSSSDADNASLGRFYIDGTAGALGIDSWLSGTGAQLPIDLQIANSTKVRVFTSGRVGFNTTTDDTVNQVQINGAITATTYNNLPVMTATVGGITPTPPNDVSKFLNGGGTYTVPPGTGKMIQTVYSQSGALATGTTQIPGDDTIPQNTEGDEYLTLAITPTSTTNLLVIHVQLIVAPSATAAVTAALFQDTTANALTAAWSSISADNNDMITVQYIMAAGTTSATTFKVRAGMSTAGTTTINGWGGNRRLGGVANSYLSIQEVAP